MYFVLAEMDMMKRAEGLNEVKNGFERENPLIFGMFMGGKMVMDVHAGVGEMNKKSKTCGCFSSVRYDEGSKG